MPVVPALYRAEMRSMPKKKSLPRDRTARNRGVASRMVTGGRRVLPGSTQRFRNRIQRRAVSKPSRSATTKAASHAVPRWAIVGIFLLLLVAGIAYARVFLMPVVLAFLLALIFSPVRRFLERRGVPVGVAAGLIVGLMVALLFAAVALLAEPASQWIADAPEIGRQVEQKVRGLVGPARAVLDAEKQVGEIAEGPPEEGVQEVVVREQGFVGRMVLGAPSVLGQTGLSLALLFFLLASGDMIYEKTVHAMPTFKDKRRAVLIAFDIERTLSRYLFTITVINAGLGIAVGTAMAALGMPNPLLFGVVVFVANFVPYLGAIFGAGIVTIVGLVTFPSAAQALVPGAVYLVLNAIEGQFITPYFVGRRLKVNPVAIFLSVAFWAWLWSIIGMLVAVPLLVTIRTFCEHIPQLRHVGDFLSARGVENGKDEGAPETPDRVPDKPPASGTGVRP